MAKKGSKKTNLEATENFLQYEEEIVNSPIYSGMPDARRPDGSIQWEAPSNRSSGMFQFTHDKRYKWWENKAKEVGISINEDKWISKVAKKIHPTKLHPCKVCGRIMDIRYCYLSSRLIKRIISLPFYDGTVEVTELTHIIDFVSAFIDKYGDKAYEALPSLLKCAQEKTIPSLPHNLDSWIKWIETDYIPKEPSLLSPGVMSNAPDRLDGFHTFNRCCRARADKGRSKENLASYSSDRRAFENWSDGNWITANKLMGYINSNSTMKKELCANESDGGYHPRPCSADHIGPISLGFCHRPEFQFLCKPCNSAKNNRMYYSDIKHLIRTEQLGETVTTWYATSIWNRCKTRVFDKDSALRLSRIMRDNRNIAMMLLNDFIQHGEFLFLLTLLNLNYANYEYEIIPESVKINNHVVSASFSKKESNLRYVNIQKTRKIRIAFTSLLEYANKSNRNSFLYTNPEIEKLKGKVFFTLSQIDKNTQSINSRLIQVFSTPSKLDKNMEAFLSSIDINSIDNNPLFIRVKDFLIDIMDLVAEDLAANWDSSRYSREIDD